MESVIHLVVNQKMRLNNLAAQGTPISRKREHAAEILCGICPIPFLIATPYGSNKFLSSNSHERVSLVVGVHASL